MGELLQFNQNPKNEIFFFTNQGDILKGRLLQEINLQSVTHAIVQVKNEQFKIPKGFYFFGKRTVLNHLEEHADFHFELIKKVLAM